MFYVYVIHFEDFYYYIGKRKCPDKFHPWNDPYTGSPKTHKDKWKTTKFIKVVIECFKTDKEASDAERNLLEELDWRNDKYCLNENCGGLFSYEANRRGAIERNKLPVSEKTREKTGKRSKELWSDPEWRKEKGERILQILREQSKVGNEMIKNSPEIREKISKSRKGKGIGKENSQYGTIFIHNPVLRKTTRVKKDSPIPAGWLLGAKFYSVQRSEDEVIKKREEKEKRKEESRLKKEKERQEKIEFYSEWYKIYRDTDFSTFCQITGYNKSQQNLCDKFKTFVSEYSPKSKNGK